MENKKWTDSDLRTAFEDGCKFLHFKDLQDFLLKRRQLAETSESTNQLETDSSLSMHNVVGSYSQEEIEAAYDKGLQDGYACMPSNL